ncbi:MAG: LuxR C-terminal-related transcriptional regulator [Anaerolineae bacterium]
MRRPRLIERLNEGLRQSTQSGRRLTLISAPAGYGKTALVSEWVAGCGRPTAWLSLDAEDSDLTRLLAYLVAALRTLAADMGEGVLGVLQSPQPPPVEALLTALLNEIAAIPDDLVLVLDDYHVTDARSIDDALTFLLEHLPPQMHVVIATREDPQLPLPRLRARNQMTELRAADLRFTPTEAAEFLNQVMGLDLSEEEIAALETRTEGWIAGLQLAAISMQGHTDVAGFIESFAGSHHYVLDYLVEEVLQQQSKKVQTFLLRTSLLDRMCGPLCDAVVCAPSASGQEMLQYLERTNLFLIPLDNERRWYRYHHLFAELLRQRLRQREDAAMYHILASQWYEDNGLEIEAFQHAVAANDVERAERLMEGRGIPLHFRGALHTVLAWLESLPKAALDARPLLWVRSATIALMGSQTTGVEEKLQAAEKALQGLELDDKTRDLIGQIAAARATLAVTRYQPEATIIQAHRALEHLSPANMRFRFTANWALVNAYQLQGDRAAASQALAEALAISQASPSVFSKILAASQLGQAQELDNQLHQAAETYRRVLQMVGDQPLPNAGSGHLGLARIYYQWNDLDAAERHGQQGLQLVRHYDRVIDRFIVAEVFLASLKLVKRDVAGAAAALAETEQYVRLNAFLRRMPEVAAAQVLMLLQQGDVATAALLADTHELPMSQARVHLARGDTSAALAVLEPLRQQMEAKGWQDERLKVMVLQAVAHHAHGDQDKALQILGEALALAEPGGFIRLFVDEGLPMARLLSETAAQGMMPGYVGKLLSAFQAEEQLLLGGQQASPGKRVAQLHAQPLIEPLSQRELEILALIAQGLSNREIAERLFLALDTVKGHNRRIFGKLQVQSRTEAIARARELSLL